MFRSFLVVALVSFAVPAFAAETGTTTFNNQVKLFRAALDQGQDVRVAAQNFSDSIAQANVSTADVEQYLKERLTAREYESFKSELQTALRGVDPSTITPAETAELVQGALAHVSTDGLSWSPCATEWTGLAMVFSGAFLVAFEFGRSDFPTSNRWGRYAFLTGSLILAAEGGGLAFHGADQGGCHHHP